MECLRIVGVTSKAVITLYSSRDFQFQKFRAIIRRRAITTLVTYYLESFISTTVTSLWYHSVAKKSKKQPLNSQIDNFFFLFIQTASSLDQYTVNVCYGDNNCTSCTIFQKVLYYVKSNSTCPEGTVGDTIKQGIKGGSQFTYMGLCELEVFGKG